MATITAVQLVAPVQLAGTDTMYYLAPAATSAKITRAIFFNSDTAAHFITINLTATTSSAVNQVIYRAIAPNETYVSPELAGQVLPPGWMIRGLCDLAAKVSLVVSGMTIV